MKAGISTMAGCGRFGLMSCAYGILLANGDMSLTVEQPPTAATTASATPMDDMAGKVLVDLMTNPYSLGHL